MSTAETGGYNGEHKIIIKDEFGNVADTFETWKLVPVKPPKVNPPSVKTNFGDNPGGDGLFDLSEVVTGYPLLGNREGSWEFYVLRGWNSWNNLYSDIMDFCHGRRMRIILDDDPRWYYNGRIGISEPDTDDDGRDKITISYSLDPYKLSINTSTDADWSWDDLNFETGYILPELFGNISFNGTTTVTFSGRDIGRRPVTPVFNIKTGTCTSIKFHNEELWGDGDITKSTIESSNHWMDVLFTGFNPSNVIKMEINGKGTMAIEFRQGRL